MKRLIALVTIALAMGATALAAQQRGYWVFIPETTTQLYYIAPATYVTPDKDKFYPIVNANVKPVHTSGPFCDTFRQAISMEVRRREGKDIPTALGYMEGAWGGKKVCRNDAEWVVPIAHAQRLDDKNLPVLLVRWLTTDGRILYKGQYNF